MAFTPIVCAIPLDYQVDPGPVCEWLRLRLAEFEAQAQAQPKDSMGAGAGATAQRRLLQLLDWDGESGERRLHRWLNEAVVIDRRDVEEALASAGVAPDAALLADEETTLADAYPGLVTDVELEPDGFCESCHEVVTPIGGACPWCDRQVSGDIPQRMYCKREDTMMFPAVDGNCWRCGGVLKPHGPARECGCGCGATFTRFDRRGRERTYLRGHAPRTHERAREIDPEPFARWLEQELRDLDPIEAVSRRTGVKRTMLLALLNRQVDTVGYEAVRRALYTASRAGQGAGMPPRPGAVKMIDLYPGEVRSTVCPSCSGRKAKHAERCRKCAEAAGAYQPPQHQTSLTEDQLLEARELRERGRLSFLAIAYRMQPRTRMTNVESVQNQLQKEFRNRGWSTERLDGRAPRVAA